MAEMPKRSKPKRSEPGSLFESAAGRPVDTPQVLVLSSNFTIGPLLARGSLLPDPIEGDSISDAHTSLRLCWSSGVLPVAWVTTLVESARNVIPIAIRLRPGREVRNLVLPECSDSIDAISISDVDGMFFRTEKERVRFESLEFSNYDLASTGMGLGVEASLFEGPVSDSDGAAVRELPQAELPSDSAATSSAASAPTVDIGDAVRAVRSADTLTGLLAFLLTGSPGNRPWMEGVQRQFAKIPKGRGPSWPELIASAALGSPGEASPADKALLAAVVDVLRRYPVEGGWPADQVLAEVTEAARSRIEALDERAVGELGRWAARSADVLASKTEPQSLADDGFVLQRAILLLLLRGDLEGLTGGEAALSGPLRPGPVVRGTASALAALRTGLRAMPARYKRATEPSAPGHFLAYLGEVFLGLLQAPTPSALVPPTLPLPTIAFRSIRTLQGEWIVSISSKEVTRTPSDVDRGLERLLTMGQHLGFEFQEHGDNGLIAAVSSGEGRTRPVYLELLRGDHSSGPLVRFSAPTLKVMGVGSKSRMTRDLAFDLLRRNADPGMNCRFAINDDATEVLVLVDQLLGTLDDAEFLQHIRHVAKVAEEFELSRSVGTVTAS